MRVDDCRPTLLRPPLSGIIDQGHLCIDKSCTVWWDRCCPKGAPAAVLVAGLPCYTAIMSQLRVIIDCNLLQEQPAASVTGAVTLMASLTRISFGS